MAEAAALPPAPTGPAGTSSGAGSVRLLPGELSFQTLVDFARSVQRVRGCGSQARKEAMVQGFIQDNIVRESRQAYDVFRLLLPHLDMHRPPYMLQEARLSTALLLAAAIPEGSDRWQRIKGWIDPTLADKHTVGQFAEVLSKSLFQDHCGVAPGTPQARRLKVAHVNELLDRLSAAAGDMDHVVPVLLELYQRTTPQQLVQLVQIIQRDYRIQLSEAFVFPRWHLDAEACYAHCFDARQVFNGLWDPSDPFQARLELGQCAQPQLSLAMYSSRALVENMQQLEAKERAASAAEAPRSGAGMAAGAAGGNGWGNGGGGRSGRLPTNGSRGGARGNAAAAGQQAGPVQFLVEIKLDGERQQIHMPADPSQPCNYFSRRGIDHGPERQLQGGGKFRGFDPVVRAQVRAGGAMLDGELLNWNRRRRRFEVFGSWRAAVRALNEGAAPTDPLDCTDYEGNLNVEDADWEAPMLEDLEACYVCWDILWADGRQLSQLPLLERHRLLRQVVRPAPPEGVPLVPTDPSAPRRGALRGRIVLLLPGEECYPGVPVPRICSTVPEVDAAIKEVMDKRMEGIVAKRLGSPWAAGDRSGNWVKFKPDYFRKVQLDGIIIGVWHGERERSGKYGEYLLGVRCCPPPGPGNAGQPGGSAGTGDDSEHDGRGGSDRGGGDANYTWASFVKVGAGLRMAEMEQLTAILEPNTCQQPPPCYRLTGHHKERPHLYIKNPLESVVLEVQADLRLVCSTYYASEYSLRFPRVERIRWDKGALQASDEEELRSRAWSRKERLVQEEFRYVLQQALRETMRTPGKTRKALESEAPRRRGRLALGACQGSVREQSSALKGCCLFILNYAGHDQQHCQKLVRQMGGSIWSLAVFEPARVGSSYTHVLAGAPPTAPGSSSRDCQARNWLLAAAAGCDVLSLAWLASCCAAGQLVEPVAADYLQMSAATLQRHPSWDPFGDDYFCKATTGDVAATLLRMPAAEGLEAGGALQDWLDGQLAHVAALTQPQEAGDPAGAASSVGGQGLDILEDERLLLHRISMLAAGQEGGSRLAAELVVGVDAELAELGLLDASALMHGCRVAAVTLLPHAGRQWQLQGAQAGADPQPAASAAAACTRLLAGVAHLQAEARQSQARLAGYAASSLAGLVASHGGSLCSSVDDGTTHLLVVKPPAWPRPAAWAAVAEAIAALAASAEEEQASADQAEQEAAAGTAPAQAQPPAAGAQPAAAGAATAAAAPAGEAAHRAAERLAALPAATAEAPASCAVSPVEPAALLAAVSRQAGGPAAVAVLRRRLAAGRLAVVAPSWVEATVDAAAQRGGLPLPPAAESEHALPFAGDVAAAAADWIGWPWERFAAASTPAAGAAEAGASGAEAEPAGAEAVRAQTAVAEAASPVPSCWAAAPPIPALAATTPTADGAARGNDQARATREADGAAVEQHAATSARALHTGPEAAAVMAPMAATVASAAAVAGMLQAGAPTAVAATLQADPPARKGAPPRSLAPVSKPGAGRRPAGEASPPSAPQPPACVPAKRPRPAEGPLLPAAAEALDAEVPGGAGLAAQASAPSVQMGRDAEDVGKVAAAQLAAAHGTGASRAAAAAAPRAVAADLPHTAAAIQAARRAGGFGRRRRGKTAMHTAAAAARAGALPAAGVSHAAEHPQHAQRVQHPAQQDSRPHQAAEQQEGKRRRIISGGLPREQQVGRRRCLHQGAPEPLQRAVQPQRAREDSRLAQHAAQRDGPAALVPAQAHGALQALHAPQAAAAQAMPSMFDLLFGGDRPSQGGTAAEAAAAGAPSWERAEQQALAASSPRPAVPPPAPTAAWPVAAVRGGPPAASQQEQQDARQVCASQHAAASVAGGNGGRQAGAPASQGLRSRVATLQALSQRQEEERTRRQVAEASQGPSQASQQSL